MRAPSNGVRIMLFALIGIAVVLSTAFLLTQIARQP